ncbi:MAG: M15 family metallopeptidase [Chloroherpetonaceae bacterium]|nr:M15 family metallopeptidase [bacterium]
MINIIEYTFFLLLLIAPIKKSASVSNEIIVDSNLSFSQAISGTKAPKDVTDRLILLDVEYYSFDEKLHRGQLVIHKDLKQDIEEIFKFIKSTKFPIAKVIPIVHYNWSDNASMLDNNTSSFNYRKVAGKSKLSNHSFGTAIDINPFINPAVYSDGKISPKGAKYNPKVEGAISSETPLTLEFQKRGWTWGGIWNSLKDYQHFEKTVPRLKD